MTLSIRTWLVAMLSLVLVACSDSSNNGSDSNNGLQDPKLTLDSNSGVVDGKLSLFVGDDYLIRATSESDARIDISSSDESVFSALNGPEGLGVATVTVSVPETATYASASISFEVTVSKRPQPLSLQDNAATVFDLTNSNLGMRVLGNRTNDDLSVSSSDESVIRIVQRDSQSFNFMTAGPGSATISVNVPESAMYEAGQLDIVLKVRAPQQVSFNDNTAVLLLKGNTLSRPLQVQGSGQVSYNSSDNSVVEVTEAGVIVGAKNGSATITGSIAADDNYSSARASYTVKVVDGFVKVIAEVDDNGSKLNIQSSEYPLDWNLSDLICEFSCITPQNGSLNADGIIDDTLTRLNNASQLRVETNNLERIDINLGFGSRPELRNAAHIEFGGYWWIFGGQPANQNLATNDIWRSQDGYLWEKVRTSLPFSPRRLHAVAKHNNELWIAGGLYRANTFTSETFVDTVWRSSDGINWTQTSANLPVSDLSFRRQRTLMTSFDDKLQVFTGGLSIYNLSALYTTTDGTSWDQEAGFSTSSSLYTDSQLSTLNDRMVITNPTGDVYHSTDGQNWAATRVSALDANNLGGHKALAYKGKVWVIGSRNSIYSSDSGFAWQRETDKAAYSIRQNFDFAIAFNNQFWIGGGRSDSLINTDQASILDNTLDTWVSNDLVNWSRTESEGEFPGLQNHDMITFNNRLWVIGGFSNELNRSSNETWVSDDGVNWQLNRPSDGKLLPESIGKASVTEFNGALWVYFVNFQDKQSYVAKGELINGTLEWTVSNSIAVPARRDAQLVSFNNALWVIGGRQYDSPFGGLEDVWSSSDGENWSEATADFGFGDAIYHLRAVANNERMVVTGSTSPNTRGNLVIRYTSDGSQWATVFTKDDSTNDDIALNRGYDIALDGSSLAILTNENGASYFTSTSGNNPMQTASEGTIEHPARLGMAIEFFQGRLWMTGGDDSSDYSRSTKNIWVSDDGDKWKRILKRTVIAKEPLSE